MGLPSSAYAAYINSKEWRNKRKQVLERDMYECRTCTSTENLEIHHRRYDNLGDEPLEDLITLCRVCHEAITDLQHKVKNIRYNGITVVSETTKVTTRYEFSEIDSSTSGCSTPDYAQRFDGRSGKSHYPRYERSIGETEKD